MRLIGGSASAFTRHARYDSCFRAKSPSCLLGSCFVVLSLLKNLSGLGLGLPRKIATNEF
jgi:hypothetical protein